MLDNGMLRLWNIEDATLLLALALGYWHSASIAGWPPLLSRKKTDMHCVVFAREIQVIDTELMLN